MTAVLPRSRPAPRPAAGLPLAATLLMARVRCGAVRAASPRRRQHVQVCSAARILTALGVRVRVVPSPRPWPRERARLVLVGGEPGRVGDLALVTAVPRATAGWAELADRALDGRDRTQSPVDPSDGSIACPVAVRFRAAGELLDQPPRELSDALGLRDLVVEVHLLPPLPAGGSGCGTGRSATA